MLIDYGPAAAPYQWNREGERSKIDDGAMIQLEKAEKGKGEAATCEE